MAPLLHSICLRKSQVTRQGGGKETSPPGKRRGKGSLQKACGMGETVAVIDGDNLLFSFKHKHG